MLPTLNLNDDFVLADRLLTQFGKVRTDDIVITRSPKNSRKVVTEWVVGVEGAHVSYVVHHMNSERIKMVRMTTLFPGDSEFQQLLHIFRLLDTPTETQWPGVRSLRDWHSYPHWEPKKLQRVVPSLSPDGVDLLYIVVRNGSPSIVGIDWQFNSWGEMLHSTGLVSVHLDDFELKYVYHEDEHHMVTVKF